VEKASEKQQDEEQPSSQRAVKKEMQTLKYMSEGGTQIKKNLFNSWIHLYQNESTYYFQSKGIVAPP